MSLRVAKIPLIGKWQIWFFQTSPSHWHQHWKVLDYLYSIANLDGKDLHNKTWETWKETTVWFFSTFLDKNHQSQGGYYQTWSAEGDSIQSYRIWIGLETKTNSRNKRIGSWLGSFPWELCNHDKWELSISENMCSFKINVTSWKDRLHWQQEPMDTFSV